MLERAWRDGDAKASREADLELHCAVVDASHNATLILAMSSIFEVTKRCVFDNLDLLETIDGSGEALLKQHMELGKAILEGDQIRAIEAATNHIDFVLQSFKWSLEYQRREAGSKKRRLVDAVSK